MFINGSSDGEIKKYVPKQRQKRKRSDPEWNQYMEKCMLAGLDLMLLSFGFLLKLSLTIIMSMTLF